MQNLIEASLETKDGIADCSFELMENDGQAYYSITILYPNIIAALADQRFTATICTRRTIAFSLTL